MGGVYLACCMRGLEVTRHFTPALGNAILLMVAVALAAGGVVMIVATLLRARADHRGLPPAEIAA